MSKRGRYASVLSLPLLGNVKVAINDLTFNFNFTLLLQSPNLISNLHNSRRKLTQKYSCNRIPVRQLLVNVTYVYCWGRLVYSYITRRLALSRTHKAKLGLSCGVLRVERTVSLLVLEAEVTIELLVCVAARGCVLRKVYFIVSAFKTVKHTAHLIENGHCSLWTSATSQVLSALY